LNLEGGGAEQSCSVDIAGTVTSGECRAGWGRLQCTQRPSVGVRGRREGSNLYSQPSLPLKSCPLGQPVILSAFQALPCSVFQSHPLLTTPTSSRSLSRGSKKNSLHSLEQLPGSQFPHLTNGESNEKWQAPSSPGSLCIYL
jgi:hypothetical protein